MLIGILSDSHGRYRMVRRAVELFDRLGAELIIHCGDVGDARVFDELAGRDCRFVWGNMDDPRTSIRAYLQTLGIPAPDAVPLTLELDGSRILVFHGHERGFPKAITNAQADYILHGHTHQPCDKRIGPTRVINPGALYRADPPTVATLETQADEVKFYVISDAGRRKPSPLTPG